MTNYKKTKKICWYQAYENPDPRSDTCLKSKSHKVKNVGEGCGCL